MKMGTVIFVCDGTLVDIDERELARADAVEGGVNRAHSAPAKTQIAKG